MALAVYLLLSAHLYFVCEWLKTSSLVPVNTQHYTGCLHLFKQYLKKKDLYNVCDFLNHQSNFNLFVSNLVFLLLCVYVLVHDVVTSVPEPALYWTLGYVSALGFSLLQRFEVFRFSLTNHSAYTALQLGICLAGGTGVGAFVLWQAYRRRIRYGRLLPPVLVYGLVFVLFHTVTASVSYHLHHALCAGFLSLCFTDFDVRATRCAHAVCMGIFIQGIDFYTVQEIFLFNIDYVPPPSFYYMTWLCALFPAALSVWFGNASFRKLHRACKTLCKKENEHSLPMEAPLLLPTREHVENEGFSFAR